MEIIKKIFIERTKTLSFYLLLGSLALGIAGLILYIATGKTEFTPELSVALISILSVGIALNVGLLFVDFSLGNFFLYAVLLIAWLQYFNVQINYITNILVGIDNTSLTAAFVFMVIITLLAWIAALIAGILCHNKSVVKGEQKI